MLLDERISYNSKRGIFTEDVTDVLETHTVSTMEQESSVQKLTFSEIQKPFQEWNMARSSSSFRPAQGRLTDSISLRWGVQRGTREASAKNGDYRFSLFSSITHHEFFLTRHHTHTASTPH